MISRKMSEGAAAIETEYEPVAYQKELTLLKVHLNQGKSLFQIMVVGPIDHLF